MVPANGDRAIAGLEAARLHLGSGRCAGPLHVAGYAVAQPAGRDLGGCRVHRLPALGVAGDGDLQPREGAAARSTPGQRRLRDPDDHSSRHRLELRRGRRLACRGQGGSGASEAAPGRPRRYDGDAVLARDAGRLHVPLRARILPAGG